MTGDLHLPRTLRAWGGSGFEAALKRELAGQTERLPLQQALRYSNQVAGTPVTVILRHVREMATALDIEVDILYQGQVAGCSCTDDPTPQSELDEHCPLRILLDKANASAALTLLDD